MEPQTERRIDDTTPKSRSVQHKIYRQMGEAEKLRLVFDTYRVGQRLAMTGICMRHPEATDEEVRRIWAWQHLGSELFDKAYGVLSHG